MSPRCAPFGRAEQGGVLIEVMVSILICAFGLLGFVALQARASAAEFESYQRSQALVLLEDMTQRINANRAQAAAYVTDGLIGGGSLADCAALVGAQADLCEWANLLRGSAETRDGANTGAMLGARGCITRAGGASDRYVISIAWVGIAPSGAPADACGSGTTAFTDERLRRVVSSTVCVARLRDPDTPPALPRC